MTKVYDIAFPNLGIYIESLRNSINVGGFKIAYYGIIIALAMLIGFSVVLHLAKKRNMNEDNFYDVFILVILLGIIGARAYYVIFNWDYYAIRPYEILDIRAGGLGIFGGIILTFIGLFVYCFIKKCNIIKIADLSVVGLAIGQGIGRWGNFFNMEAYGTYTNNIVAMRMNQKYLDDANIDLYQKMNIIEENGANYVQAHPTFLYESLLCLALAIVLIVVVKKFQKFDGEILAIYLLGYGIIRFCIESLRTDSLMFGSYKASQLVAIVCVLVGLLIFFFNRRHIIRKKETI